MSDAGFLKGSCRHCGGHIEFPAAGAGLTVDCPHCGQKTLLAPDTLESAAPLACEQTAVEPAGSASQPRKRVGLAVAATVVLVLAGGSGIGYWYLKTQRGKISSTPTDVHATTPDVAAAPTTTNPAQVMTSGSPTVQSVAPKSPDDLKVGPITLEKGKGTSLVYAVGVLKNHSDYQRFGVKIELDLEDAKGEKVGTAKDYRAVLEPRQDWRFRALILDNRATSARLASIEEDQ